MSVRVINDTELRVEANRPSDIITSHVLDKMNDAKRVSDILLHTNARGELCSDEQHTSTVNEWQTLLQTLSNLKNLDMNCRVNIRISSMCDDLFLVLPSYIKALCTNGVKKLQISEPKVCYATLVEFLKLIEADKWRVTDGGAEWTIMKREETEEMGLEFGLLKSSVYLPETGNPLEQMKQLKPILTLTTRLG